MAEDENKKSVNRENLTAETNDRINSSEGQPGLAGMPNPELVMTFDPAHREKILMHDDSYIILGGDRISSKASGYGGKGHTGAHMIDLVVGRDPKTSGNPSFIGDAARIYISQKTDIDYAMGAVEGNVKSFRGRSAVGIKADGVRIVAREGIKLITMGKGTRNSHGNKIQTYIGIDLIAGNDDKGLEPIALAYKVSDTFTVIIKALDATMGVVSNLLSAQAFYNDEIMNHVHPPPGSAPSPTLATAGPFTNIRMDVAAKVPMKKFRKAVRKLEMDHCQPFGPKWVGSRYNYSN